METAAATRIVRGDDSRTRTFGLRRYAPRKGFHDTMHSYLMNLFSGDATGRLLKYEAATGRTTTLVDGLWYRAERNSCPLVPALLRRF